jgi:RNA polymerase sigma-70 factor (ECF subfamily)
MGTPGMPVPRRAVDALGAVSMPDLVARAAGGDREAFAQLVEPRLDRTFRTACAMLDNEADARDVLQDAFLAAWRELPRLRDFSRFDAWLNRIVRNRCRDVLRRRRRAREIALDDHDSSLPDTTDPLAETAALNAAFDRLPAGQRQLLVLHHLHRLPVGDLAAQLGIPVGTVKWRLHRARRALAGALEAEQ